MRANMQQRAGFWYFVLCRTLLQFAKTRHGEGGACNKAVDDVWPEKSDLVVACLDPPYEVGHNPDKLHTLSTYSCMNNPKP